jgi:hypothetical protein
MTPQTADLKVRVSADLKAQVVALAASVGESEGVIVRQALNAYLAKIAGKTAATLYPEHVDTAPALAEPPPAPTVQRKAGRKSAAA